MYTVDENDIPLVEMLADLAEENEVKSNVDDDSVLESQYSTHSEPVKNDPDEEEAEDLNITSLDLDNLSSWESMCKEPDQLDNLSKAASNKPNTESTNDSRDTEENYKDVTLTDFPQFDGVDDLHENTLEYKRECANHSNNEIDTACCSAVECLPKNNKRAVVRETRCLKKDEYNRKMEEKLRFARCQSPSDHRDLDVYDADEIE